MLWYDDDEFWEAMTEIIFTDRRWEQAELEIDQLVALLGLQPHATILDLCCGPGRHAIGFAKRGFDVAGVDRTNSYLETARRRALRENVTVEFILADMREFCRPHAFDAVLNMFTTFGYFKDSADDRIAVASWFSKSTKSLPAGT